MSILNIRSKETVSISPVQNFHRDLGEIGRRDFWISARSRRDLRDNTNLAEISVKFLHGQDHSRPRAVVLLCSEPRAASEKVKLCKLMEKEEERLGRQKKKGLEN